MSYVGLFAALVVGPTIAIGLFLLVAYGIDPITRLRDRVGAFIDRLFGSKP